MENIDEINKLKEELEIRDKAVEHFRKEALHWAKVANSYKKDKDRLERALEKIIIIWVGEINKIISDCEGKNE